MALVATEISQWAERSIIIIFPSSIWATEVVISMQGQTSRVVSSQFHLKSRSTLYLMNCGFWLVIVQDSPILLDKSIARDMWASWNYAIKMAGGLWLSPSDYERRKFRTNLRILKRLQAWIPLLYPALWTIRSMKACQRREWLYILQQALLQEWWNIV